MNHVGGQPIDPFQLVYGCGMFVSQLPERVTGVDSNETLLGQSVSVECGQLALGDVNQRVRLSTGGRGLEES